MSTTSQSQLSSQLQRDFYHLGILEIILGSGLMIASLLIPILSLVSNPDMSDAVRIIVASATVIGFFRVAFLIFSNPDKKKRRTEMILSIGTIGIACAVILVTLVYQPSTSTRMIMFCVGVVFLTCGFGLLMLKSWGPLAQKVICVAVIAGMVYSTVKTWNDLDGRFLVVAIPVITSHLLIFLLLLHPESEALFSSRQPILSPENEIYHRSLRGKLPHIGVRIFVITTLFAWGFALVGIPSILSAEQRIKQRRTMTYCHLIAMSIEAYALDHQSYPQVSTIVELAKILEPTYVKQLPRTDGWNRPLEYYKITNSKKEVEGYVIRSAGSDGIFEYTDPLAYPGVPISDPKKDLVYSLIGRSQWPEGTMAP